MLASGIVLEGVLDAMLHNADPLGGGELIKVGRAPEAPARARAAHATEGYLEFVIHSLIVDMHHPHADALGEALGTFRGGRMNGSGESVGRGIDQGDGFFVTIEECYRRHWTENFLAKSRHLGCHVAKHRGIEEIAVTLAASDNVSTHGHRAVHDLFNAARLGLVDQRAEVYLLFPRVTRD